MRPQQDAYISGYRNVLIQTAGDNNTISIDSRPRLLLHPPRNRSQAPLNSEIDILKANNEAVPFIGRDAAFGVLWEWLRSPKPISVQTLVGSGGSGKTRLGIEALRRLSTDTHAEWQCGLIDHVELRELRGELNLYEFAWQRPTLMVLDYAASRVDSIKTLVRKLYRASESGESCPVRLLLLERFADPASGWLEEVIDRSFTGDTSTLFERVMRLPAFGNAAERYELLRQTVAVATRFHPGAALSVPALGTDPAFDLIVASPELQDPLVVMMAALNAFSTGWPNALSRGRTDLADRFAQREANRISQFAPDSYSAGVLKHMAAFATLSGGLTFDEVVACCRTELADLEAQYPGGAPNLARDLRKALPGDSVVPAIGPDIVAEAFVISVLQGDQKFGSEAVRRSVLLRHSAIAFVTRALIDFNDPEHPAPRQWLGGLIELARANSDTSLLFAIERAIPEATTGLREAAVDVSLALLQLVKRIGPESPDSVHEVAKHHMTVANRLNDLGRPWDALPDAEESVRIARELAGKHGDTFRPTLAMALTNLTTTLVKVGRPDEAVVAIEEAVSVYRQLVSLRAETFLPFLATCLSNLPNALVSAGRTGEALAPIEEAVLIYRQLAGTRADEFLPGLALALGNLANVWMQAGRTELALGPAEESLSLYRQLATRSLDAFGPELARSLINISVIIGGAGRIDDAIRLAGESVGTCRKLAAAYPEAFLPSLSAALNNLANLICDAGRPSDAVVLAEESVSIRRSLADARPDSFLPELARSLASLARCSEILGQPAEAAGYYHESLSVIVPAVERLPEAHSDMAAAFAKAYLANLELADAKLDERLINRIAAALQKRGE